MIRDIRIQPEEEFVSFDVESLFTQHPSQWSTGDSQEATGRWRVPWWEMSTTCWHQCWPVGALFEVYILPVSRAILPASGWSSHGITSISHNLWPTSSWRSLNRRHLHSWWILLDCGRDTLTTLSAWSTELQLPLLWNTWTVCTRLSSSPWRRKIEDESLSLTRLFDANQMVPCL